MRCIGIIPARFASTRFPGKPLADILGKPMIQWVYEKALEILDEVVIATDHADIVEAAKAFNAKVVLTSEKHENGSSRVAEAYEKYAASNGAFDVIVNIQGDEPMLASEQIVKLISAFDDPKVEMATLAARVNKIDEIANNSEVFLTLDVNHDALYFSRNLIPAPGIPLEELDLSKQVFHKHIGLYAFKPQALLDFISYPSTYLEKTERLEQLRWLEHGRKLRVALTESESYPVDTPEDLLQVIEKMKGEN